MRSCLITFWKPYRIGLVVVLSSVLPAWTCSANFTSCFGVTPQPQIIALSPDTISAETVFGRLIVVGSGFVSDSEILWNGNALQTTFMDSEHLEARITQQTLESFGGSSGSSVLISVMSPQTTSVVGCSAGGNSATLTLMIN